MQISTIIIKKNILVNNSLIVDTISGFKKVNIFAIILIGLFAGGLIFNYLNEKSETIYSSWLVHMFANFAINTVGFILFGII